MASEGTTVVVTGGQWSVGDGVTLLAVRAAKTEGEPPETDRIATGRVVSVWGGRARVSLGDDVRVPVGSAARRADDAGTEYPLAPPRLPELAHVGFDVRAFLPIGVPAGVGGLLTAYGLYRLEVPVAIRLNVNAAGFVTSSPGGGTFDGNMMVSLDTQYFEVGLGAGALTQTDTSPTSASLELAQLLRIGSIDGLMTQIQTSVYVADGRFQFSTGGAMIQTPITRSWWLQMRGMWAQQSWFYGELAARHLLVGNGDRGSLFVTGAVGGTGVGASQSEASSYCCVTTVNGTTCTVSQCTYRYQTRFGGPSVAVGFEWRL